MPASLPGKAGRPPARASPAPPSHREPRPLGVAANHTSPVTQLLRIKAQAESQPLCAHSDPLNSSCGEGMNE